MAYTKRTSLPHELGMLVRDDLVDWTGRRRKYIVLSPDLQLMGI
jgi:hypothetical protein